MNAERPLGDKGKEILAQHIGRIRFEGKRHLSPEQTVLFEQARALVIQHLEVFRLSEARQRVESFSLEQIYVFDRMFDADKEGDGETNTRALHFLDGTLLFSTEMIGSPLFLHAAVHELFHAASKSEHTHVETSEFDYVQDASGLSKYPVGDLTIKERKSKRRFFALNEAITDTLAFCALPEDAVTEKLNTYTSYRLALHYILRKMVEDKRTIDPSYSLKDAWTRLVQGYIEGDFDFLQDLERIYGKGMARKIAQFGNDREEDLGIVAELHPTLNKADAATDIFMMMHRYPSQSGDDIEVMQKELRDALE